jgi:hypothetical protein
VAAVVVAVPPAVVVTEVVAGVVVGAAGAAAALVVGPGGRARAGRRGRCSGGAALPHDLTAAPAPVAPTPAATTPAPAPAAGSKVFPTDGGIVVARSRDGVVDVVSATPAQGWGVHDEAGEDRGRDRIELRLSCADGVPQAQFHD